MFTDVVAWAVFVIISLAIPVWIVELWCASPDARFDKLKVFVLLGAWFFAGRHLFG